MSSPTQIRHFARAVEDRKGDRDLPLLSVSNYRGVIRRSEITADEPRADDLSAYRFCAAGDIVINRMSAYQGALGRAKEEGVVSPDYLVLRLRKGIDSTFIEYLFKSHLFVSEMAARVRGIGSASLGTVRTPRINWTDLGAIEIDLPNEIEQRQIAEYLDRETGKIDELITKQEQLVATLTERREAFISQMLVGGDMGASERSSTGHQWVHTVPIGWTLRTVRSISRLISKGTTPSTIGHDLADEGIRFLRGEDIQGGTIQNVTPRYISPETNLVLIRSQLRDRDVLFVIAGTLGKTAVVQLDDLPANVNQAISFVRLNNPRDADFLHLWFSSRQVREMTASAAVVSAQPNLSMESLGRIVVPVPPAVERDRIVSLVSVEIRKIDASISMAAKLSQLVRERRAALISAAVTGKIDVRGL